MFAAGWARRRSVDKSINRSNAARWRPAYSPVSGATVTLSDRPSEVSGSITDTQSRPVLDYTLVLYPSDQRYRTAYSRRIQSSRPSTDGRFTFRNVPPGEYRLAPVLDPEPGAMFDPAFLQHLDGGAITLSVSTF